MGEEIKEAELPRYRSLIRAIAREWDGEHEWIWVVVPGWNPHIAVRLLIDEWHPDLKESLRFNLVHLGMPYRFYGMATIGAEDRSDFIVIPCEWTLERRHAMVIRPVEDQGPSYDYQSPQT